MVFRYLKTIGSKSYSSSNAKFARISLCHPLALLHVGFVEHADCICRLLIVCLHLICQRVYEEILSTTLHPLDVVGLMIFQVGSCLSLTPLWVDDMLVGFRHHVTPMHLVVKHMILMSTEKLSYAYLGN